MGLSFIQMSDNLSIKRNGGIERLLIQRMMMIKKKEPESTVIPKRDVKNHPSASTNAECLGQRP